MKAQIVKKENAIFLLFNTGEFKEVTLTEVKNFLDEFTNETLYPKEKVSLFSLDILKNIDAEILATIDDEFNLIFHSPELLKEVSRLNLENYITVKEYADLHEKSLHTIQKHCLHNRIQGLIKLKQSTQYLIPKDAPYPQDPRKK